mgnify:CR=1 FL=1
MNKSKFLIFIVIVFLLSSIYVNAQEIQEPFSIFGWLKSLFIKKNVIPVQAQPTQNNNVIKIDINYYKNFPDKYLQSLNNKCVIYDRILNYCYEKNLKKWNDKSSYYYKFNDNSYLSYGNSMLPLIPIGSNLAVQKYNPNEKLYSCEIIRFKNRNGEIYYHRIIGFDSKGNIITRGDNNAENNYEIIKKKDVLYRVCGKIE